jgi:acyl dehydratase
MKTLLLGDVSTGQALPELRFEMDTTTVILGALAARDWQPQHHDRDFAQQRNGMKDIFVNTPHIAAFFERYITDWTGPKGRLGKLEFQMLDSVYPGDTMVFQGEVERAYKDSLDCGWVDLSLWLVVSDNVTTRCQARVALPLTEHDNPWSRRGTEWQPEPEVRVAQRGSAT